MNLRFLRGLTNLENSPVLRRLGVVKPFEPRIDYVSIDPLAPNARELRIQYGIPTQEDLAFLDDLKQVPYSEVPTPPLFEEELSRELPFPRPAWWPFDDDYNPFGSRLPDNVDERDVERLVRYRMQQDPSWEWRPNRQPEQMPRMRFPGAGGPAIDLNNYPERQNYPWIDADPFELDYYEEGIGPTVRRLQELGASHRFSPAEFNMPKIREGVMPSTYPGPNSGSRGQGRGWVFDDNLHSIWNGFGYYPGGGVIRFQEPGRATRFLRNMTGEVGAAEWFENPTPSAMPRETALVRPPSPTRHSVEMF